MDGSGLYHLSWIWGRLMTFCSSSSTEYLSPGPSGAGGLDLSDSSEDFEVHKMRDPEIMRMRLQVWFGAIINHIWGKTTGKRMTPQINCQQTFPVQKFEYVV